MCWVSSEGRRKREGLQSWKMGVFIDRRLPACRRWNLGFLVRKHLLLHSVLGVNTTTWYDRTWAQSAAKNLRCSNPLKTKVIYIIQGDRSVGQPEDWYLVLSWNECSDFELVREYVGMAVQKLHKSEHRSRDLTPSQEVALKPRVCRHVFFTSEACWYCWTLPSTNPIWNARMILGVPSRSQECQKSEQCFI
jgi:hypothetical protein